MAAGVEEEMFSFIQKFQQLSYNGFDASLNFNSYQGTVYVNFNASLGHLMYPPQPAYTNSNYVRSSGKKFNIMKPSRIRRKKRREEKRHSGEDPSTDNLLDLDVPLEPNDPEVMDSTNNKIDEDITNFTLDVTDTSFIEPSVSSSNSQDLLPQDNPTSTATVPDSKYWEQMYGMLLHLTTSAEKSSPSLNASGSNLSGFNNVNPSQACRMSSQSYLRQEQ